MAKTMQDHAALTEANRKLVRGMYDAALAGNMAGWRNCFDENVVLYEPAFLPYGGRMQGLERFLAAFGEAGKYMDVPTIRIDSMVADGETVVAFIRVRTIDGTSEVHVIERATVRNGRIVEMRVGFSDVGSMAAIFR